MPQTVGHTGTNAQKTPGIGIHTAATRRRIAGPCAGAVRDSCAKGLPITPRVSGRSAWLYSGELSLAWAPCWSRTQRRGDRGRHARDR